MAQQDDELQPYPAEATTAEEGPVGEDAGISSSDSSRSVDADGGSDGQDSAMSSSSADSAPAIPDLPPSGSSRRRNNASYASGVSSSSDDNVHSVESPRGTAFIPEIVADEHAGIPPLPLSPGPGPAGGRGGRQPILVSLPRRSDLPPAAAPVAGVGVEQAVQPVDVDASLVGSNQQAAPLTPRARDIASAASASAAATFPDLSLGAAALTEEQQQSFTNFAFAVPESPIAPQTPRMDRTQQSPGGGLLGVERVLDEVEIDFEPAARQPDLSNVEEEEHDQDDSGCYDCEAEEDHEEEPSLVLTDGSSSTSSSWEDSAENRVLLGDVARAAAEAAAHRAASTTEEEEQATSDPLFSDSGARPLGCDSFDPVEQSRYRMTPPSTPSRAARVPFLSAVPRGVSEDVEDMGGDDRYDMLDQSRHTRRSSYSAAGSSSSYSSGSHEGYFQQDEVTLLTTDWPGEGRHERLSEERRQEEQGDVGLTPDNHHQESTKEEEGHEEQPQGTDGDDNDNGHPGNRDHEGQGHQGREDDNNVASSLAALTENVADILLNCSQTGCDDHANNGDYTHHADDGSTNDLKSTPATADPTDNAKRRSNPCCAHCGGLCHCLVPCAPCGGWSSAEDATLASSSTSSWSYDRAIATWLADASNGRGDKGAFEAARVLLEREVEAWRVTVEAEIARLMGLTSDAAAAQLMALRSCLSFFVGSAVADPPSSSSSPTTDKTSSSSNRGGKDSNFADAPPDKVLLRNRAAVMHAQARRMRRLRSSIFPAEKRTLPSVGGDDWHGGLADDGDSTSPPDIVMSKSVDEEDRAAAARRRESSLDATGALTASSPLEDASPPWAAATAFVRVISGDWADGVPPTRGRPDGAGRTAGSDAEDDLCYDSDPGELIDFSSHSRLIDFSSHSRPPLGPRRSSMFEVGSPPPNAAKHESFASSCNEMDDSSVFSGILDSSSEKDSVGFAGASGTSIGSSAAQASVIHSVDVQTFDINDEDLVSSFIKELTTGNITLVWHPSSNQNGGKSSPVCVEAWFEMGSRLKTKVIQPKFMWREAFQPDLSLKTLCASSHIPESVELLNVVRILKPNAIDRERHPFAKLQNTFKLLSSTDEVFLFEASSKDERDRVVHGLKLVVARLASKIIVGDENVFAEFFTPWGQAPEALSPSPSSCNDSDSYDSSFSVDKEEEEKYMRGEDVMSVTSISSSVKEESQRKDELWGSGAWAES